MRTNHPLRLVAPWYRWERQMVEWGRTPRQSRPAFQKFETPDVGNAFLVDPQLSLTFTQDDCAAVVEGSSYAGPIRSLADRRFLRIDSPIGNGTRRCDLRKLFLDLHKRFYLVVCELHCDTVGFPDAGRDRVCETGFVVRRHALPDPATTAKLAGAIGKARGDLRLITARAAAGWPGILFSTIGGVPSAGPLLAPAAPTFELTLPGTPEQLIRNAQRRLDVLRESLRALWRIDGHGDGWEKWVPHESARRVGSWVDDESDEGAEAILPLYPLIPDPTAEKHSAEGATLFYGVVPTSSLETQDDGAAQFDEQHLYTIRCFVRQHREGCPRKPTRGDCSGPLVWSEPTEPYQLAAHFDLAGTRNTVVTVHMPDLPALAAQVAATPVGKGGSLRMVTPPESMLPIEVVNMVPAGGAPEGGGEICVDSIPLITIVAKFVLELFKPIVIYLFKLYYLLPLKFCWGGPAVSLSPGGLDALAILEDPDATTGAKQDAKATIVNEIVAAFNVADAGDDVTSGAEALINEADYDFDAIASLARDLSTPIAPPSLLHEVDYEARVTPRPRVDDPIFVEPMSA